MTSTNTHKQTERTPEPADLSERLAHESPEGRPAHPELGLYKIGMILATVAVVMLSIALVIAFVSQSIIAVYIGIAAVVAFLANPMFWVAIMRGREREQVSKRMSHEH